MERFPTDELLAVYITEIDHDSPSLKKQYAERLRRGHVDDNITYFDLTPQDETITYNMNVENFMMELHRRLGLYTESGDRPDS